MSVRGQTPLLPPPPPSASAHCTAAASGSRAAPEALPLLLPMPLLSELPVWSSSVAWNAAFSAVSAWQCGRARDLLPPQTAPTGELLEGQAAGRSVQPTGRLRLLSPLLPSSSLFAGACLFSKPKDSRAQAGLTNSTVSFNSCRSSNRRADTRPSLSSW